MCALVTGVQTCALPILGAALPGLPVVNIGFTRDLAWSHTVNTSAHFTLYALTLDPADPTRYKVGGTWLKMARATVAITIKDDDGGLKKQSHDFWRTINGPVGMRTGAFGWDARTAYAVRDAKIDR